MTRSTREVSALATSGPAAAVVQTCGGLTHQQAGFLQYRITVGDPAAADVLFANDNAKDWIALTTATTPCSLGAAPTSSATSATRASSTRAWPWRP